MPTNTTTVRIFFASPSDVVEETALLTDLIEELNHIFAPHRLCLDLVHWVVPDVDQDAQAVINRGVGDEFDLFIATLWTRVGTPTERADSGTIEEYERALAIAERRPDFRVCVFFNTAPPANLDDLDLGQMAGVRSFKQRVANDGCLFREYRGSAEFHSLLRRLLGRYLGELSAGSLSSRERATSKSPSAAATDSPEVMGYFDYAREATELAKKVGDVNIRLAQTFATAWLAVANRARELEETDYADSDAFALALEAYGAALIGFGDVVAPFSDEVEVSYARALGSYANALIYLGDIVEDLVPHAARAIEAVSRTRDATSFARANLAHARTEFDRLPRLSGAVINGKARAIEALDELLHRYDTALRLADETIEAMSSTADANREPLLGAPGWTPADGAASAAGAALTQQAQEVREPIDVNQASEAALQEVPGIGPAMARRIVEWREKNGRFESLDDLLNVRGIGVKTLDKMRPSLRVDKQEQEDGQDA